MNKKHPKIEVIIPIVNPSRRSVLFFKRNRCWFLINFNQNNEQRKTKNTNFIHLILAKKNNFISLTKNYARLIIVKITFTVI